eukprot:CAMPEP_0172162180 /NCGR_PEP_ID=MMETSP1050-20130122/6523_1 /TAXON_ID=233186 /ORGANISM="Cryptomonas curvata, Strain CCAP979/52" /LENGTH=578 /DNA_ID=CAMNT_0012832131 /DNA_START=704 /DNA_END=2441 /DNA_ORIENTATION=-
MRFSALKDQPHSVRKFQPILGARPLLTEDQLKQIIQAPKEDILSLRLIGYLQVKLETINRIIVSSENNQWLRTVSGLKEFARKPDLLICNKAFIRDLSKDGSDRPRGIPGHEKILQAIDVLDVKCDWELNLDNLDGQPIGELFQHLECIRDCKRYWLDEKPVLTRGALLSKQGVAFVSYVERVLHTITTMNWSDEGSEEEFLSFFASRDPWSLLLSEACNSFSVDVVDLRSKPFLGCGRAGFVCKVAAKSASGARSLDWKALKIVCNQAESNLLRREAEVLEIIHSQKKVLSDFVVKFESFAFISSGGFTGAALLMSPVGKATLSRLAGMPTPDAKREALCKIVQSTFETLYKLHSSFVYHGDARIHNTIFAKDSKKTEVVVFCDLSNSDIHTSGRETLAIADVHQFLESVRIPCKVAGDKDLRANIDDYGSLISKEPTLAQAWDKLMIISGSVRDMLSQGIGDRLILREGSVTYGKADISDTIESILSNRNENELLKQDENTELIWLSIYSPDDGFTIQAKLRIRIMDTLLLHLKRSVPICRRREKRPCPNFHIASSVHILTGICVALPLKHIMIVC